ncbi:succinyl-CoA synthetase subunit alpha [Candidatus Woesearchaeota archaeon]|nr:succinyl-CoA synthetase subunit alpha [Candidatus Woesearchaeota archaeon]
MDKNYQFFMKTNIDPYVGQWIAICKQKIVSFGEDVKLVFRIAKEKHPNERILLTRVPDKETMIF